MTPRRRILHFAKVMNRDDFIDHVIRFLDAARFEPSACTMVAEPNIADPRYDEEGIPHHVLPARSRWGYPRVAFRLVRLLRREGIDLLHTHHYWESLVGVVAGRIAGVPVVVGRHYSDEHYRLASGSKLRGLRALEGVTHRLARRIVVPTEMIRDLVVEREGVDPEKLEVIPYGFDFDAGRYRRADPSEVARVRGELGLDDAFVVGNVARHHEVKGVGELIAAAGSVAPEHPELRLLLVGDGPHHGRFREMVERRGLGARTTFTGWRTDAPLLMEASDVVAHPTRQEAFPQTMVEAMALARPLIITPVSGAGEHVRNGENGYLVPIDDPPALAAALRRVLADPDAAAEVGRRARAYVRRELDIEGVAARYGALYDAVLGAPPAGESAE